MQAGRNPQWPTDCWSVVGPFDVRQPFQAGLSGVELFTSDKCLGLVEALGEYYPEAVWQRCMVHWCRRRWGTRK